MSRERELVEEGLQFGDGEGHQFGDGTSAHLDIVSLRFQPCAVALGTDRLAAVASQHHPVLYLVQVLLHHAEEGIDALEIARALPQHLPLLIGQFVVGGKDGKSRFVGIEHHLVAPFAHHLASPADHGSVIDRERAVGHHQVLVNAYHAAETLTLRTGSKGRDEGEHLVIGLFKGDAVCLELGAEAVEAGAAVSAIEAEEAGSVAFIHGRLQRVGQPADALLLVRGRQAVYQQENHITRLWRIILDTGHLPVYLQALEPLLQVNGELLLQGAPFTGSDGRKHGKPCPLLLLQHAVHDVLHRMFLHLLSAYRAIGSSDAGKEQTQVLVDFRGGTHGGARISGRDLLFDGNGRGYALDVVTFRFAHPSEKLAGIAAEALHIAPLSFGIECVKGQ